MSKTYKAIGINLQAMQMGEADRLLTILSPERGLIKAIAVGSRKPRSKLGGRSSLFVVNELLLAEGRNFDRIVQAETLESYPGLAQTLSRLAAGQYLVELTLGQALGDHPQSELFFLLQTHLKQIEQASPQELLPRLSQASFSLLCLAGLAPQVYYCGRTRRAIQPNFSDRHWRVGFSIAAGGIFTLNLSGNPAEAMAGQHRHENDRGYNRTVTPLTAEELAMLQELATLSPLNAVGSTSQPIDSMKESETIVPFPVHAPQLWLKIESLLRAYAQHHLDHPLRSAVLLESCFSGEGILG